MLAIDLVHHVEQPRHPADPRLDRGEAQFEAFQDADAHRLATGSMVGDSEWVT